jgi:hypothetical protein
VGAIGKGFMFPTCLVADSVIVSTEWREVLDRGRSAVFEHDSMIEVALC